MSPLSLAKTKEAAEALIDYVQRIEKQSADSAAPKKLLLDDYADDDHSTPLLPLDLVLATKKIIADHKSMTPVLVPLPNQFFGKAAADALEPSICLIVRDIKSLSPDAAIDFYTSRLVEPTKSPATALAALQAEASKASSLPPLKDLANIKIDRVITFSQLRNEYKPFQARRKLISEHDLFFLDSALARADNGLLMPRVMGKSFYAQSKTVPQPVALTSTPPASVQDAENVVQLAIRNKSSKNKKKLPSTFITNSKTSLQDLAALVDADSIADSFSLTQTLASMYSRIHGTHYMVAPSNQITLRIGSTALTPAQIAANAQAALAAILEAPASPLTPEYLKGGWPTVRGVYLKTSTGPSLPIYVADSLYEDAAKDVIADASEALPAHDASKDSAHVAKSRRAAAAKISNKRINQLLLDEIVDEDSQALLDAPATHKEATPEPSAEETDDKQEKKKLPATPNSKKRREREGAPSPASIKKEPQTKKTPTTQVPAAKKQKTQGKTAKATASKKSVSFGKSK